MAEQTCRRNRTHTVTAVSAAVADLLRLSGFRGGWGGKRTSLPDRTLAEEGGHAVVAGGAVEADGDGAVVDVLAAVVARPAVDADAVVAAVRVVAGAAVLAGVGHQLALVHVLRAVLAWKASGKVEGPDSVRRLKMECIPVAKFSPV